MKKFSLTAFILLLGLATPLLSDANESVTPDFGMDGQITTEFSIYDDKAFAVTVQPDGKILVAGQSDNGSDTDIAIARYHKDGRLDADFNQTGQATISVGSGNDSGLALTLQSDGKILVAGTTDNGNDLDVAVVRLHSNGILDMDFSQDGQVVIALPNSDDRAQSVLLQKDGKIVLAGSSESKETSQIFLARLNGDGSLDKDFGDKVLASSTEIKNSAALSASLRGDGRILLAGFYDTDTLKRAALISYMESGELDQHFGNQGIVLSGTDNKNSLFYDLEILKDGRILAAGATSEENYHSILLAKFTDNGTADPQFNGKGLVQTDLGIDTIAYGLAVAKDGSIYLGGSGSKSQDTDFILLHFSANGYPLELQTAATVEEEEEEETVIVLNAIEVQDSMNPGQPYTLTDFASYNDIARSIYILDDGTILLVGSADNGKDTDFALLSYSPEELAAIRQTGGIYTPEGHYIATTPIGNITRNSTTTGGYLHWTQSSATVTQRGVCYGVTPAPVWKDDFSMTDTRRGTDPTTPVADAAADAGGEATNLNPFKTNTILEGCTSDGSGKGEFRSDLIDLTPDTTYYVRAYAILSNPDADSGDTSESTTVTDPIANTKTVTLTVTANGTITRTVTVTDLDTNEVISQTATTTKTATPPEDGVIYGNELQFTTQDACFVATAAHGSIDKTQVTILRQFRDTYLKSSLLGTFLIHTYYHLSPPLAEMISAQPNLQYLTRMLLAPITAMSYFALHPLLALQLLIMMLFFAALLQKTISTMAHTKDHPLKITAKQNETEASKHTIQSTQGFTLIELLVVLVIIGILAGYVGPRIMGRPDEAKRTMAMAQISGLETALESYRLDNGAYPSTEQGLQALVEAPSVGKLPAKWRKGGYLTKSKVPKDPWENEYIYLSPGSHGDFDISSHGADHESGGEDADADVNNWEIE